MESFDGWIEENNKSTGLWCLADDECVGACRMAFKAGQQSKQAEIDKLKMSNHYLSVQVIDAEAYSEHWKYQRDKLQKRIDEALKFASDANSDLNIGMLMMVDILKGDQS